MDHNFWQTLVSQKKVFARSIQSGGGSTAQNIKLVNPAASGRLLVVKSVMASEVVEGSNQRIELRVNCAVTALANGPLDGFNLYNGETVSVGKVYHEAAAAVAGSEVSNMYCGLTQGSFLLWHPEEPGIVVPQNSALCIVSSSGDIITGKFVWAEYPIPS